MKEKLRELKGTPMAVSAIAAFIAGMTVHLFSLVNVIHNHDNVWHLPTGYGTGVESGRWLLSILGDLTGKIFGGHNTHYLIGLMFVVIIALSAGLLCDTLRIKSRGRAILLGAIFASFPTTASILFYRFTSVYYALAVLFAVAAAWSASRFKYGFIAAPFLIAFSMGLYQAFLPLAIGIFILVLMRMTIEEDVRLPRLAKRGVTFCGVLLAGLALYYLFLNGTLALYDTTLGEYKNIDSMGKLSLSTLPGMILSAYKTFFRLPIDGYAFLADWRIVRWYYMALFVINTAVFVYLLITRKKRPLQCAAAAAFAILFPLAVNFVQIMAPGEEVTTLMAYAFVLIPCTSVVFMDLQAELPRLSSLKRAICALVAAVIGFGAVANTYTINVSYTAMYYFTKQTENYFDSMITQVRMTEGYTPDKSWAVIGSVRDPLLDSNWEYVPFHGGVLGSRMLVWTYSRYRWINNSNGYRIPFATGEQVEAIMASEEFKAMPCWPSDGSIAIIDNIVVVKCSEDGR